MDLQLFIGYFLATLAVLMVVLFGLQLRQCWQSLSWPSSVAVILTSEMTECDEGNYYDVDVTYAYRVAGCDYVGTRTRITGTDSLSQRRATRLTRKYAPNAVVHAYYNPAKPSESLLEPGFTLGLIWLLCCTIIMVLWAWSQFR